MERMIRTYEDDPAFDRIILQEKRWWGWKTVEWQYYDLGAVMDSFEEQLMELKKQLGSK